MTTVNDIVDYDGARFVFTEPWTATENPDHVATFGTDTEGVSRCDCSCLYEAHRDDALEVLNEWRGHVHLADMFRRLS